jgi:hypothetical protein
VPRGQEAPAGAQGPGGPSRCRRRRRRAAWPVGGGRETHQECQAAPGVTVTKYTHIFSPYRRQLAGADHSSDKQVLVSVLANPPSELPAGAGTGASLGFPQAS